MATMLGLKESWKFWACFVSGYKKATTTSVVMGHLLGRLSEEIRDRMSGNFKTFCIGLSLGGQICGLTGKNYRYPSIMIILTNV